MNKDKKEIIDNIINFKKEMKKEDMLSVLEEALNDNFVEYTSNRLESYYSDFLKMEKYAACDKRLSEISDKIENIKDEEIKELFEEYRHYLEKMNEYDVSLANALGIHDGVLFGIL